MPLIALVLRMLGGLLVKMGPAMVYGILASLGVSVVTFVGVDIAIEAAHAQVRSNMLGLPSQAAAIAGLLKLDVAVQIIFAAITGRLALQLITGAVRKIKF